MEEFDLYNCDPGSPTSFGDWLAMTLTSVWLDGVDGFFDQYFEGLLPGEHLRFIAVPIDGTPLTANARFLEFPFVNATVLKGESAAGEVRIDRVIRFSDWLKTLVLPIANLSDVARAAEIDPSVLIALQTTINDDGYSAWVRPVRPSPSLSDTREASIFRFGGQQLCVCLRSNAISSIVARLT